MNRLDDTIARYDPLEAVVQISEITHVEVRTVAQVLEGEIDYLACLGLLDDGDLDEASRHEIDGLKKANADILDASDSEYDPAAAVAFVQRNRGIEKETIVRILEANYRFMEERGFLDDEWGMSWDQENGDSPEK